MNTVNSGRIAVVAAKRTAIGSFCGSLATTPAHILGKTVIENLLVTTKIKGEEVSEVIMGQVLTTLAGQNPARQASINAGIPDSVPAFTINQVCGSGLKAIALGAASILSGSNQIVIAGGQENMSMAPHATLLRSGVKMGNANLIDTMIHDGLFEIYNGYHMGVTAENLAEMYKISRDDQDDFAAKSQQKCEEAQQAGKFNDEIIKVVIRDRKSEIVFDKDEFPRNGTTKELLTKLRAAFAENGTVTAGNASGINDGAAAVILMSELEANKRGLKPLCYIKAVGQSGVDPKIMGIGPVNATKNALKNANWNIDELDLIEANEAFAAQAIAVNKELGWSDSKINVNGGAIALGHPIGASGARIMVSLIHEMQRRNSRKGLATLCIGGGMGIAVAIERD